jgi:hypothetical protein
VVPLLSLSLAPTTRARSAILDTRGSEAADT